MIGGNVIETIVLPDKVWVNCREGNGTCAIYVTNTDKSRTISEGDTVWWQSGHAYWTPKSDGQTIGPADIKLERIGFSGVSRPSQILSNK